MKHRKLWILLAVEAAVCILLGVLRTKPAGVFTDAMAFPFEQIGLGLRALSLSGDFGNVAAFTFYIAASLLPAAALPFLAKRRGLRPEDCLLGVLSMVLFAVLYLMINPGIIASYLGGAAMLAVGKAALGCAAYSVLCGYLVLRVLRLFFAGSTDRLQKYMAALLCLMNILFVYVAFGACFVGLLDSLAALQKGNTGGLLPGMADPPLGGHSVGISAAFLILQFIVNALPYVLDLFVVFAALRLLDELRAGRYSQESVAAARSLSRLCGMALAATALASIAFNLLQLLFAKTLLVINGTVQIPVLSIAFVLAVLLLARFVAENKRLKDDNELFI